MDAAVETGFVKIVDGEPVGDGEGGCKGYLKWEPRIIHPPGCNPTAQYNLGLMYDRGLGVAQDEAEAANWFRTGRQGRGSRSAIPHAIPVATLGFCTRPVLDHEWLAELLRQPLTHQSCEDVGHAPGSKADDDAHRPRRIGLRSCRKRSSRPPTR